MASLLALPGHGRKGRENPPGPGKAARASHFNTMESGLDALLPIKGLAVAGWLGLLFVAERIWPAAAPRPGESDAGGGVWRLARNGGLWLLNVGLASVFVIPVSLWAAGHTLDWRPAGWDGPAALVLDLLVLDLLIYWWHRANHEIPFLWRFHEVHHLDRFLDSTSAVRFHAGEVALSAVARAGVIMLLDIPIASVLIFEVLVLVSAIFHHSNIALPPRLERALARVVVTPSIHWVHHHAVRRDTDSNYATILSLWDPLFATRSKTRRHPQMPIGVAGGRERRLPYLLARPFRRRTPVPARAH